MITVKVSKTDIQIEGSFEPVTSGAVNSFKCEFAFGEAWDGMSKTATFRAGKRSVSVIIPDDGLLTIPWEVLEYEGVDLYVGVTGMAGYDTPERTDDIVLPTVWAMIGTVRNGASVCGFGQPATPGLYEQIMIDIAGIKRDKQDKLHGKAGQVVGFDEDGNAVAQDTPGGGTVTVDVNGTETLEPGMEATVDNVGDEKDARLAFGIPSGADYNVCTEPLTGIIANGALFDVTMSRLHRPPVITGSYEEGWRVSDVIMAVVNGEPSVPEMSGRTAVAILRSLIAGSPPGTTRDECKASIMRGKQTYTIAAYIETTGGEGPAGSDGENGKDGSDGKDAIFCTRSIGVDHVPEVGDRFDISEESINRTPDAGEVFPAFMHGIGAAAGRSWICFVYKEPFGSIVSGRMDITIDSVTETTGMDGEPGEDGVSYLAYNDIIDDIPDANKMIDVASKYFSRPAEVGETFFGSFANVSAGYSAIGILRVMDYVAPSAGMEDAMSSVEVLEFVETSGVPAVFGRAVYGTRFDFSSTHGNITLYDSGTTPRPGWQPFFNVAPPKFAEYKSGDDTVWRYDAKQKAVVVLETTDKETKAKDTYIAYLSNMEISGEFMGSGMWDYTLSAYVSEHVKLTGVPGKDGPEGPAGPPALVYEGVAVYSSDPVGIDAPISLFNRAPIVDDHIVFTARGEGDAAGKSWTCTGTVSDVSDSYAHVQVTSYVETTGNPGPVGKPALVCTCAVTFTTEPKDFDMPSSLFNRTPEDDDSFTFVAKGDGDMAGRSWICTAIVIDSSDPSSIACAIAQSVETTGLQNPFAMSSSATYFEFTLPTHGGRTEAIDITNEQFESILENGVLFRIEHEKQAKRVFVCDVINGLSTADHYIEDAAFYDTEGMIIVRSFVHTKSEGSAEILVSCYGLSKTSARSAFEQSSVDINGEKYSVSYSGPNREIFMSDSAEYFSDVNIKLGII